MNPAAGLRWSAGFFGVFWTVGMIWLRGAVDPGYIVITAISGSVAGWLWYLVLSMLINRRSDTARK